MSLELKPQDLYLSSVQGLKLYYLSQDGLIGGQTRADSGYEPFETNLLLDHLMPDDVVVDIGANIGVYTLPMAKQVGQTGKVYAFEPVPRIFDVLMKNLQANQITNVIAEPIALLDKSGGTSPHLTEESRHCFDDRTGKEGIPAQVDTLSLWWKGWMELSQSQQDIPVLVDTLEHVLFTVHQEQRPINLIKIDTEGCEPFIILEAKEIISQQHPTLFLEYWPYGYRNGGADAHAMISFLLQVYKHMYFIDEVKRDVFMVTQEFIDNYCQEMDGKLHCNLAFFGRGPYASRS